MLKKKNPEKKGNAYERHYIKLSGPDDVEIIDFNKELNYSDPDVFDDMDEYEDEDNAYIQAMEEAEKRKRFKKKLKAHAKSIIVLCVFIGTVIYLIKVFKNPSDSCR